MNSTKVLKTKQMQSIASNYDFRLTPENLSFLSKIFEGEDNYKEHMNNLAMIRKGIKDIADTLPETNHKKQKAYELFATLNHIIGAIIFDKRPPYYRFEQNDDGTWYEYENHKYSLT
ncbi:MAG: hypothetical protein JWO92_2543 [Chitinophagaceae bacterium]|nr:hypothetical protein [Chitinophagaceae bacterium]